MMLTLLLTAGLAGATVTSPTSCDVKTGASCLWGEGCDCDHDGYVHSKGKSQKYCHWTQCPIDANDSDPNSGAKPSEHNADGDGFTTEHDCDDHDPCVDSQCGNVCVAIEDADNDGSPAGKDCDDQDAAVVPGAPIACCACEVLSDPTLAAQFGCAAKPCPGSLTDTGPADTGGTGGDTGGDTGEEATAPDTDTGIDAGPDTPEWVDPGDTASDEGGGGSAGLPMDLGDAGVYVGSGGLRTSAPPPPGCSASTQSAGSASGIAAALLLLGSLFARRRRSRVGALARALAVVALSTVLSGCAMVKPWQRECLAQKPMSFVTDGEELKLEEHVFQYREGAAGGFGFGGGGCGCN